MHDYVSDVDDPQSELNISVFTSNPKLQVFAKGLDLILVANEPLKATITINISDGQATVARKVDVVVTREEEIGETGIYILFTLMIILLVLILLIVIVFLFIAYKGTFKAEEIYLIYESGLLVSTIINDPERKGDPDVISGMFTALKESIAFSLEDEEKGIKMDVKTFAMGDKKVLVEYGATNFLVLVGKGIPGIELRRRMSKALKAIEAEYEVLGDWRGIRGQVEGIEKYFVGLIKDVPVADDEQEPDPPEDTPV